MKIALIGATGFIGSRIRDEAARRGHDVLAVTRDIADALDPAALARAIHGRDVLISAFGAHDDPPRLVDATHSVLAAVRIANVPRVLFIGGAGSLEIAPGVRLIDSPDFPDAIKAVAAAGCEMLDVCRNVDDVEWTYASPPASIVPGSRTAVFRVGTDALLVDERGISEISAEDFAVAVLDEVEDPRHVKRRFTAAY